MNTKPALRTLSIAALLIAAQFGSACLTQVSAADDDASAAQKRRAQMLTTPARLKQDLGDAELRILDVRSDSAYRAGHIPGAARLDISAWKTKSLQEGGLHDSDYWSAEIGKLGIGPKMRIVVYGQNITNSARAWWTLKYLGLQDVALLDGGWAAWKVAGDPVENGAAHVEAVAFTPQFQAQRLMEFDELRSSYEDKNIQVIDARSAGEYAGSQRAGSGRIPGAVHLEWKELLDKLGRFKSNAELTALFASKGVRPQASLVAHCQSGARSSVDVFALELAGFPKVRNYYCGWSQWGVNADAPKAKSK